MKKNNLSTPKSKCCYADIKLGGIGDFNYKDKVITMYYICTKCGNTCDSISANWNKKHEKIRKKETKKEIRKY